jgi:serine/threonine protein phosphatase PrpC
MQSNKNEIHLSKYNDAQSEMIDIGNYRIGYFICRKNESKSNNEDALFIFHQENNIVMGVSDGAGGHPKGDEASSIATKNIIHYAKKNKEFYNYIDAIENANQEVINLKAGAFCTLSMCFIQNDEVRYYSVGDSEIVHWNAASNEIYSNVPHSLVGYLVEGGAVSQEDTLDHPDRHYVCNLIGDPSIRIETTSKVEIKKGHTILIGSDGLFDNFTHQTLAQMVSKGQIETAFETLCKLCTEQNPKTWKKDDDISFILLRKIKA